MPARCPSQLVFASSLLTERSGIRGKLGEKTVLVNTYYENKVDQLRDVVKRLDVALTNTGIRYQVVGGFAVFCHVDRVDPTRWPPGLLAT